MGSDNRLTAELYVRADTPIREQRATVIDRLRRLEREDRIRGFTVHSWPRAVCLDLLDAADDGETVGVFRSFEAWAERRGLGICPPFEVRTIESEITGEADEQLVLPVMCLAAYDDQELVGVFPCRDGESAHSIEDGLDAVTAGEPLAPESRSGDDAPPQRRRRARSVAGSTEPNATPRLSEPTDRGSEREGTQ